MDLSTVTIGYAVTGSFCTFKKAMAQLERLSQTGAKIIPIMSEISYTTDTRFGTAESFRQTMRELTGNEIVKSVKEAEPFGPKALLDLMIIAPCTGNSLAKMATGVTDSSVTMAAKAHLRNQRPVLLGVSTNDGLANAAKNIGTLLNSKHIYFIPFGQDDAEKKPNSLVADFNQLIPAAEAALAGKQLQPILV